MKQIHVEHLSYHVSFNMIFVEGGTFMMGGEDNDQKPIHGVGVESFYIGQFPITQDVWKEVMSGQNPSFFQGDSRPVENISWLDCQEFIKNINQKTGHTYRLPTEAEWEYAARGGQLSKKYIYAGSNKLEEVGWYEENSDKETKPVGLLRPNELGLFDMSGNIREWCWDWYGNNYYEECKRQGFVENPKGAERGNSYIARSGSWFNDSKQCKLGYRYSFFPTDKFINLGLRLVLSPPVSQ